MSENLLLDKPFVSANLTTGTDTLNYTIPTPSAGIYSVIVSFTDVPPSGVTTIVKQNGSTVFTAPVLGQSQGAQQFKYSQLYAAADAVSIVISSAIASDKVRNNFKATVTIQQGL
jgi:hypothetical protein